jgi:hypothetical protein
MNSHCEVAGGRMVVIAEEPDWSPDSDPRKVVKWSKTAGTMSGSQTSKAIKLVAHNCIQYSGDGIFVSLPLDTNSVVVYKGKEFRKVAAEKDYNKDPTPYEMHRLISTDEWVCHCQWNQKMHLPCAHILALKVEFKRKRFGRNQQ